MLASPDLIFEHDGEALALLATIEVGVELRPARGLLQHDLKPIAALAPLLRQDLEPQETRSQCSTAKSSPTANSKLFPGISLSKSAKAYLLPLL